MNRISKLALASALALTATFGLVRAQQANTAPPPPGDQQMADRMDCGPDGQDGDGPDNCGDGMMHGGGMKHGHGATPFVNPHRGANRGGAASLPDCIRRRTAFVWASVEAAGR